jgi:hypothetical protein
MQYDLYYDLQADGITDINFLDRVPMIDTLEVMRDMKGYFKVTDKEKDALRSILID